MIYEKHNIVTPNGITECTWSNTLLPLPTDHSVLVKYSGITFDSHAILFGSHLKRSGDPTFTVFHLISF
jgi:hypothetical protein